MMNWNTLVRLSQLASGIIGLGFVRLGTFTMMTMLILFHCVQVPGNCRGTAKNIDVRTRGSTSHLDKLRSLALHGCSHGIKQSLRLHVAAGRGEWLRVQCQGIAASNSCGEPCISNMKSGCLGYRLRLKWCFYWAIDIQRETIPKNKGLSLSLGHSFSASFATWRCFTPPWTPGPQHEFLNQWSINC